MDVNDDGLTDVVGGGVDGIYVFERNETGEFDYPYILLDTTYLNLITFEFTDPFENPRDPGIAGMDKPFLADWDRDGVLDLLFGDLIGHVYFYPGTGVVNGLLGFGTPERLKVDGEELYFPHGWTSPCVADWDGDGNPDLLLGEYTGSVLFFRNTSNEGKPVLAQPVVLIPSAGAHEADRRKYRPELDRGRHATISVADWNGDGYQDLIVGTHLLQEGEEKQLNLIQQAELDAAWENFQEIDDEFFKRYFRLQRRVLRKLDLTSDSFKASNPLFYYALGEIHLACRGDRRMKDILKRRGEASLEVRKFLTYDSWYGRVWVYLRKPYL